MSQNLVIQYFGLASMLYVLFGLEWVSLLSSIKLRLSDIEGKLALSLLSTLRATQSAMHICIMIIPILSFNCISAVPNSFR